jgi:GNAT superfamily N-acetyltransferase
MPAAGGTSDPAGQAGPAGAAGAAEQAGAGGAARPGVPARTIRAIGRPDVRPTAAMLARAFYDDPLMAWILPDERIRRRRLAAFFAMTMRGASLRHEGPEILLTGGQVLGCGNWMPPGTWRPPAWRQLATLPGLARTLRSRLGVASAAYGTLMRAHPREPHWYLAGLGTDPPAQRTGVGSELMRSRLARCDAAGLPAYLESSKASNVPFYQGHGFTVTGELRIPDGGPTTWLMWRTAQPGQAG